MLNLRTLAGGALILISAAGITASLAGDRSQEADERKAFRNAAVTLADAMLLAEAETGGAAIEAEFDQEYGAYVYEVETIADDGASMEVMINPANGDIIRLGPADDSDTDE